MPAVGPKGGVVLPSAGQSQVTSEQPYPILVQCELREVVDSETNERRFVPKSVDLTYRKRLVDESDNVLYDGLGDGVVRLPTDGEIATEFAGQVSAFIAAQFSAAYESVVNPPPTTPPE